MMEAGPELDALVAERVMGWKRLTYAQQHPNNPNFRNRHELTSYWHSEDLEEQRLAEYCHDFYTPEKAWSPSTDIAAAWQVVERLAKKDIRFLFKRGPNSRWAAFYDRERGQDEEDAEFVTEGSSDAHAICLAALKAMGVDPQQNA